MFVHTGPHWVSEQVALHVPFVQNGAVAGHAMLHPPQFTISVAKFTHETLHASNGGLQSHAPAVQS